MLVSVYIGNGYSHTAGNIGQQGSSGVPSFFRWHSTFWFISLIKSGKFLLYSLADRIQ